ncbi:hypothetical protein D187_005188 [Cystobacter fuscus DSM 2262]|uniref:Lipoprotein n=1 Tax=Cystobacter fuscus (strain ATCC 25194 / DSM 2262 / NBRC 100088 / M29) TaxID=1242864 RepID=S9PIA3_CYSF2|nr:hypothetical protein [Cystobacter fuscus]EPX64055.1 hypothetical protein D187_005188 [Cystobacter fuscus DSM 2262]
MNNKWIVCLALALTGCGGSGLGGTWKGEAAGWSVTVVLDESTEQSGTSYFMGTVSSNKPACFTNGTAAATLVNGKTAQILSSSSGSASTTTVVDISGELSGNTLVGYLEATSTASECDTDRTAITLTRQ